MTEDLADRIVRAMPVREATETRDLPYLALESDDYRFHIHDLADGFRIRFAARRGETWGDNPTIATGSPSSEGSLCRTLEMMWNSRKLLEVEAGEREEPDGGFDQLVAEAQANEQEFFA